MNDAHTPPPAVAAPSTAVQPSGTIIQNADAAAEASRRSGVLPVLEGYQIESELGRGGMGVVYAAWDLGLKRSVAIKMLLHGAYVDHRYRDRLEREARAAAGLSHPNIIRVFDFCRPADALPYIAMERTHGGNLEEAAAEPWQAETAAEMVRILADAVEYAHRSGVIHRDLKPANILLHRDPRDDVPGASMIVNGIPTVPKIADFGLGKRVDDIDDKLTDTGASMGTPDYAAPEQLTGNARDAGPAADVYALGAILYRLLTGRSPFAGASYATIFKHAADPNCESPTPRGLRRDVCPILDAICAKALAKNPEERYASAAELATDLRHWLVGEPTTARPGGRLTSSGE